jgi:iron complex transport system ATP-binding protein
MILEVRNGTFSYGREPLLQNISFALHENDILTILGPNGAGKTTLLRCILGFLPWNSGETLIEERSMKSLKEQDFWKCVSYVPQSKRSAFSYRVIDTVVMGLDKENRFFHIPGRREFERAEATLCDLAIEKLAKRNCCELSGGELQLVLLARAMVSNPKILILDEPEANLDMKNQLRVIETIERANKVRNTTIIINTHFPTNALRFMGKTLMLGRDHKWIVGRSCDVINEENVRRFFQTDAKILSFVACGRQFQTIAPYRIADERKLDQAESF